ncbi:hypothetical protein O181_095541 [Austropuccinia psidii MF-1]|uniref:Uncharacterized protein n=1 Tax=Austropuccinia psidii MF-1 TaxID=1389203 RepID=A0A9Q3J5M9_9BASI|nr:hypothetical protein [Austropuccinia psidii MF-1]
MDKFSAHGLWKPPEAIRSSQFKLSLHFKGNSSIPPCTLYSRLQEWCIYGIIYHYAPFFLSNSMVKFSGPNYIFPIKFPKSNAHFEGGLLNSSFWKSMAAIRRPFKHPNLLALQQLGWQFHSGLFQGAFSEVIHSLNQFSRHQVFNTPWTTQLVHTGVNQSTCM